MTKRVYLIEREKVREVEGISYLFPCFIKVSSSAFTDYVEIEVNCRKEDVSSIERLFSSMVWERERKKREEKKE